MNFYFCSGLDPNKGMHTHIKANTVFFVIEALSVILHIAISLRICAFKWKSKPDKYFAQFKKSFENQSLSTFTTNAVAIIYFVSLTILLTFVNNMNPAEANFYPNYHYVHIVHLYAPLCSGAYFGMSYYIRHKLLRTVMKREVMEFLNQFTHKK